MNINLYLFAIISLLITGCPPTKAQTQENFTFDSDQLMIETDILKIVTMACKDAANVSSIISYEKSGRTIVILEENHDSLAGQLELAAVLVRLHLKGLTDVVLEGYIKGESSETALKPVSRNWFHNAAGTLPADVQRETAARMLKEGEINAAEFFFLAYDDVRLLPAETLAVRGGEYGRQYVEAVLKVIMEILGAVYKNAVANGTIDNQRINKLYAETKIATNDEAKKLAAKTFMNYIATLDPWLNTNYKKLTDPDILAKDSLSNQAQLHSELVAQAIKWGVPIDFKLLEESAQFFRQREKANIPIAASAIATQNRLVALSIGAGHTKKILEILREKGLGVIVVTPLSFQDKAGRLTHTQFEAKQHLRSVFDTGQIAQILKSLPDNQKKPETSITEPWLQAKGELYLFINRLTRNIIGPPTPPGGGEPPFGFDDGSFHGKFFFIDPRLVHYLAKEKAILIPLAIVNDPKNVVLWIKSTQSDLKEFSAEELIKLQKKKRCSNSRY